MIGLLFLIFLSVGLTSCAFTGLRPGSVVGRGDRYDYSPSVLQSGTLQQFWWCGQARNPEKQDQDSDAILYSAIDTTMHTTSDPIVVLAETPGAWDSALACNPKVVRGIFVNPLGDGQTYTYVMYYVATSSSQGTNNAIGAAFSNDGIHWKKYPEPVIQPDSSGGYGAAQPAVYNSDQKSGIWLFYEFSTPTNTHIEATSTDGIHFTRQGTLTTRGLDPNNPQPSWGDMAYDAANKIWYAVFNLPVRDPATTGFIDLKTTLDNLEQAQYGVQLYSIPADSLFTGASPWKLLKTVDTNSTGYECNFIPGLLRDQYGDVRIGAYPSIQIYPSISNPAPKWDASPQQASSSCFSPTWDIGSAVWSPDESTLAFNLYANDTIREATTGWIDPNGNFILQTILGHLYTTPQNGANVQIYACKSGSKDYFASLDKSCEGYRILGLNGYGYAQPVAGTSLVPLYRCHSDHDHFVSNQDSCAGQKNEGLLGYALP